MPYIGNLPLPTSSYLTTPATQHTTNMLQLDSCSIDLTPITYSTKNTNTNSKSSITFYRTIPSPMKSHKTRILKPAKPKEPKAHKKRASFTYIGRNTSYITNIFRQTDRQTDRQAGRPYPPHK